MTVRRAVTGLLLVGLMSSACVDGDGLFPPSGTESATTVPGSGPADPGSSTTSAPSAPSSSTSDAVPTTVPAPTTTTSTTVPPRPMTITELTEVTIRDLERFWSDALPAAYGTDYESVAATIPYRPSTGDLPECGSEALPPEIAAGNAFYCRPDDYVAWDAEGLFPELWTQFGDFAVALVLAHEWGHVVQARADVQGATIMTELQADCFAGAWAGGVAEGTGDELRLQPGDLEEAMAGYLLFRDPPGTSPTDPAAHGSAFDRVSAFQEGFFGGTGVCIRYEQGDFDVVSIPLTLADLTFGGDLPFEEVVPAIVPALEIYWAETYPVLFGTPWDPVAAAGPYFPSTGTLPSCGEQEPDPAQYVDSAVYCPQDDFVAWDGENLFPDLYESIGDFALAMVLAHEWATAVQVRAGLPFEGLDAELQADCLSGAWAAFMVPQDNPTEIVLSAGDLDEAVSGFLAFSDEPDGAAMTGTAFDRFDAFEDGFFNGPDACLGP